MNTLSVSEVISQGWGLAKKHGLLLACFVFVILMVTQLLSSVSLPSGFLEDYLEAIKYQDPEKLKALAAQASSTSFVGSLVQFLVSIVQIICWAGLTNIVLRITKGTMQSVSLSGFKMSVMTYLKFLVLELLVSLIVLIGTLCCIIPGLWIAVRLSMVEMYILDHPEAGVGEAIKASWNMTKGNFWSLVGMFLSNLGIVILGLCCCCIGVYFAIPFTMFVETSAYYTLLPNLEANTYEYNQNE